MCLYVSMYFESKFLSHGEIIEFPLDKNGKHLYCVTAITNQCFWGNL